MVEECMSPGVGYTCCGVSVGTCCGVRVGTCCVCVCAQETIRRCAIGLLNLSTVQAYQVGAYTHTHTHSHSYTCTLTHTLTHIHTHTHAHSHTHIHTHNQTCVSLRRGVCVCMCVLPSVFPYSVVHMPFLAQATTSVGLCAWRHSDGDLNGWMCMCASVFARTCVWCV